MVFVGAISIVNGLIYNKFITGVGATLHTSELLCKTVGDQIDHLMVNWLVV